MDWCSAWPMYWPSESYTHTCKVQWLEQLTGMCKFMGLVPVVSTNKFSMYHYGDFSFSVHTHWQTELILVGRWVQMKILHHRVLTFTKTYFLSIHTHLVSFSQTGDIAIPGITNVTFFLKKWKGNTRSLRWLPIVLWLHGRWERKLKQSACAQRKTSVFFCQVMTSAWSTIPSVKFRKYLADCYMYNEVNILLRRSSFSTNL